MTSRITNLTGITNEMVDDAPDFAIAMDRFIAWGLSADVIYAWSENDLRQFNRERKLKSYNNPDAQKLASKWKDFQKEFARMLGTRLLCTPRPVSGVISLCRKLLRIALVLLGRDLCLAHVPLAAPGDRIKAPMNEHTETCFGEPLCSCFSSCHRLSFHGTCRQRLNKRFRQQAEDDDGRQDDQDDRRKHSAIRN